LKFIEKPIPVLREWSAVNVQEQRILFAVLESSRTDDPRIDL